MKNIYQRDALRIGNTPAWHAKFIGDDACYCADMGLFMQELVVAIERKEFDVVADFQLFRGDFGS